jgi:hypothetical protein
LMRWLMMAIWCWIIVSLYLSHMLRYFVPPIAPLLSCLPSSTSQQGREPKKSFVESVGTTIESVAVAMPSLCLVCSAAEVFMGRLDIPATSGKHGEVASVSSGDQGAGSGHSKRQAVALKGLCHCGACSVVARSRILQLSR